MSARQGTSDRWRIEDTAATMIKPQLNQKKHRRFATPVFQCQ
jgi:hypothetical protein